MNYPIETSAQSMMHKTTLGSRSQSSTVPLSIKCNPEKPINTSTLTPSGKTLYENVSFISNGSFFKKDDIIAFESGKFYVFGEIALTKILAYTKKIPQLINSIVYKAKVHELNIAISKNLLLKYLPKLESSVVHGLFVYLIENDINRYYISIFSDIKQKVTILEWLNSIYENEKIVEAYQNITEIENTMYGVGSSDIFNDTERAEMQYKKLLSKLIEKQPEIIFISFSDRTIFKNELFIYNFVNYQFTKSTNNIIPLPNNDNDRIAYTYYHLHALICIVCGKDLNRSGYQNAGVGPMSLAAFEGGLKAMIRAVNFEIDSRWMPNTPVLVVINNSPLLAGSNTLDFRFLQDIE